MPLCRILNEAGQELVTFNTDDFKDTGSISIGRSSLCAVPLDKVEGLDNSVGDVHLALVRRDSSWWIVRSHHECSLAMNSREIIDAELNAKDTFTFGSCRLVVLAEKSRTKYVLAVETGKNSFESFDLFNGENSIGSAADCDVTINNENLTAVHALIKVDTESIVIEDRQSEKGVYVLGNLIKEKTFIEPEEIVFMGLLKTCVIEKKDAEKYNPFTQGGVQRHKRHWQLVNLGFFAIIFVLLCLIIWKDQKYGRTESKLLRVTKKQKSYLKLNSPELQQKIWAYVEEGKPRLALSLLRNVRVTEKNRKDYNALKDALVKEKNAVTDLNYYINKMASYNFENIGPSYEKLLLKRQQMDENVLQAGNFWKEAIQFLKKVESRIPQTEGKIASNVGSRSYFLKKLPDARDQLDNLIAFYQLLEKINILWDEQNWVVLAQMIRSPEVSPLIKRNKMSVFCNKISSVSQFGSDLDKERNRFKYTKLKDLKLKDEAKKIKELKERLTVLMSNSLTPEKLFTTNLNEYEKLVSEAKLALDLFAEWEEKPENIEITTKLSTALRNLKWRHEPVPIFDELHDDISDKVNKYVVKTVAAFKPTVDRKGIEQIDRMIQYSYLINDSLEDERYLKLKKQKDSLRRRIDRKCDELYSQYNIADENDEHDKLPLYLNKIIDLAPKNSRYHTWAEKKLNTLAKQKQRKKSDKNKAETE